MAAADIPDDIPHAEVLRQKCPLRMAAGGSAIAGPDGQWLVEPVGSEETLITAVLEHHWIRRERQNFDPSGHYSRPDITQLRLDRRRQRVLDIEDEGSRDSD